MKTTQVRIREADLAVVKIIQGNLLILRESRMSLPDTLHYIIREFTKTHPEKMQSKERNEQESRSLLHTGH